MCSPFHWLDADHDEDLEESGTGQGKEKRGGLHAISVKGNKMICWS